MAQEAVQYLLKPKVFLRFNATVAKYGSSEASSKALLKQSALLVGSVPASLLMLHCAATAMSFVVPGRK